MGKKPLFLILILLLGLVMALSGCGRTDDPVTGDFAKFTSYKELKDYVKRGTQSFLKSQPLGSRDMLLGSETATSFVDSGAGYTSTNIQVEGVDEADKVKTDGEFVYTISSGAVSIIKAYPVKEARKLSEIVPPGTTEGQYPDGLYILNKKLVVLYETGGIHFDGGPAISREDMSMVAAKEPESTIAVYDVSDAESPQLVREIKVKGSFRGSRMSGDHVYAIVADSIYDEKGTIQLPEIDTGNGTYEIPATDIYNAGVSDHSYMFTTIVSVNVMDATEEPVTETILMAASSTIYVSTGSIYLSATSWGNLRGWMDSAETTHVHRISYNAGSLSYQSSVQAPGRLLNQFAMDEYNGALRLATTTGWGETARNNVYILDLGLKEMGKLEGLAPGETIYAARFMGERCYLVTFQQVDPLFVLDLAEPSKPRVLGELKITGYSSYLHPYNEDHLIGIGKEAEADASMGGAWDQGLKISLFDVSDVSEPLELDKLEIGDRGTDSPVLWEHKAFLFDKSRELMVMPVLLAKINTGKFPDGIPAWQYGDYVWQGAYVFDVSIEGGLRLRGGITHFENGYTPYYSGKYTTQRSFIIDDVLYTISDGKLMMHDIDTLEKAGEVELG